MNKIQRGLIFLSIFSLTACAMPETRIYTIFIPIESETINTKVDASIVIHMDSEDYLKQPYIAHRSSQYQLAISKYSKWESSPIKIVRKKFEDALSSPGLFKEVKAANIKPNGFYLLKIDLKRFERLNSKNKSFSNLVFDIDLQSPDGEELYRSSISKQGELESRDFMSLAKVLSELLQQGIEESRTDIVSAINKHINDSKGFKID